MSQAKVAGRIAEIEVDQLPVFSAFASTVRPKRVLVLASFRPEIQGMYDQLMKSLNSHGIEVVRFDPAVFARSFTDPILGTILKSDLILCEITSRNPNVYYELGMAHALRKPTILFVDRSSDERIPSDLEGFLYWPYDRSDLSSLDRITDQVVKTLKDQEVSQVG